MRPCLNCKRLTKNPKFCSHACYLARKSLTAIGNFWQKVRIGAHDQCWPWVGYTPDGRYGRVRYQGKNVPAHHYAYWSTGKKIPPGLQLRHLCGFSLCCNPRHLLPGTGLENAADRITHGTSGAGEQNPRAKLTLAQVAEIRAMSKHYGWARSAMARYGVSEATIHRVRSGRNWKPDPEHDIAAGP
jgi:hypothetical protein